MLHPASYPQPFSRDALFRQIGPLVGAVMMWLLYAAAPRIGEDRSTVVIQSAALIGLTVVTTVALPWRRLPDFLKVVPPLLYLVVAFRLPELLEGRASSRAAFVLLPVFWLAVFGTRVEVLAGIFAVAVGLFSPMVAASHLENGWIEAALLVGVATVMGLALHLVFDQIRARADRLELLAGTDPLTGLANRRTWDERVPHLLRQAIEVRLPVCVAVLDIDQFKRFKVGHGRREGHRVLRDLSQRWRNHIRQTDLIARVGSDEFAVLLVGCSLEAASGIARRLSGSHGEPITTSAGVAEWDGRETLAELLARADAALSRAREAGRDRIEVASSSPGLS